MRGPGGMRGTGQHVGQALPALCVCPKPAAADSVLVPLRCQQEAERILSALPATMEASLSFFPASHVPSTCVIAVC